MIRVPSSVKHYLDNESSIPLIAHNGSMWFHITQKEKDTLKKWIVFLKVNGVNGMIKRSGNILCMVILPIEL